MKIRISTGALMCLATAIAFSASMRAKQTSPSQGAQSSAEPGQSVWDGVYTQEQASRGEALYAQKCARCHGADLTGGEIAPALNSGEFKSNWSGLSVDDLFERIKVSMPQDNPGSLSRQQTADAVAFVLSRNGFPAGKTELAREAEVVKTIRFEENRPEAAGAGQKAMPPETVTITPAVAAPIKQRVVPLRTTALLSAQSLGSRWSSPITFADGRAAYVLSLEPDFDLGNQPVTAELNLRHAEDKTDASNLLDPTGQRHGLQPYDFAADDLAEGAQKSAFGKERTLLLKDLGLVIRITILKAIIGPISAGHHQLDALELQIEVDNSNS